jgi:Bacterial SH3 domain
MTFRRGCQLRTTLRFPLSYRFAPALGALALLIVGCTPAKSTSGRPRVVRDTVEVRDPDLERRVARLELRVIEKETQVDQLETRLEDARDEVVRTMSKLQTLASRAEAASAMAEADVALQSLRTNAAGQQLPEIGQVNKLVQQSNNEFEKQNFGGALYLANLAKTIAASGRTRATAGNRGASRPGETPFAVPIRLRVASRGNVREGPGTGFGVVFAVEAGNGLTAFSYADEWIRISDDQGRGGWIFRSLVTRP